jgi:hypothetical protein
MGVFRASQGMLNFPVNMLKVIQETIRLPNRNISAGFSSGKIIRFEFWACIPSIRNNGIKTTSIRPVSEPCRKIRKPIIEPGYAFRAIFVI